MGEGKKYLNLGSGQRPFKPPWLNYDSQEDKWKPYTEEHGCLWCDAGALQYLESVDIICFHHVLEHFGCNEADSVMEQCYKLLKPGGSLLIFVPNLRMLAQRWIAHQLDTQVYMTNIYGAYMGDEDDRHKWGYDVESLTQYLRKFDFSVKNFDWRKIEGADIAQDWWIAGLEAVK